MSENEMILAENQYYDMDCRKTGLNNNVLVVGTSGSGKTRSIVIPNILQATGSYVISDPKGNLCRKYGTYLEQQGYEVKKVDFIHPENSIGYNPLAYIHSDMDTIKLARWFADIGGESTHDPFWNQAVELLFSAVIAYTKEQIREEEQNLFSVQRLIQYCNVQEGTDSRNILDDAMDSLKVARPQSFAASQYEKFRLASSRTLKSILITANAKIGILDAKEVRSMMKKDEIDLSSIGQKKTAVFVVVSDTDRSMDILANIFFTQAMNELCRYADEACDAMDNRLPVDVRFILDDFATNVTICEFPRMISSIRSRGISAMLMIQAEGQLKHTYGEDDKTIIANCDSYIYLGGNDIATAQSVAQRIDVPLKKVLNMEVGTSWIFRRGQMPIHAKLYQLDSNRRTMIEQQKQQDQQEVEP